MAQRPLIQIDSLDAGNAPRPPLFDLYTRDYESVLNRSLSPSGFGVEHFARARVKFLDKQLKRLGFSPKSLLDYGCGTGGTTPLFASIMAPGRLLGVDISPESVRLAGERHGKSGVEFAICSQFSPENEFDLGYCNGVFHHIAPAERVEALRYIHRALRPGGIFALWENNPWNPGTHYLMSRCEFDRGARLFSLPHARKLLGSNGFEVLHSSSCFYFPRWLKWLRGLEPALSHLPLGGQYLVLGRKRHSIQSAGGRGHWVGSKI